MQREAAAKPVESAALRERNVDHSKRDGVQLGDKTEWPRAACSPHGGRRPFLVPGGRARCRCGNWEFRDIRLLSPLAVMQRECPKCGDRVLLVFRGAEHLATIVPSSASSSDQECLRRSLAGAGLRESEVELLMQMAS
jgi:hypothetical protein